MNKYKIGQKVVITDNISGHEFEIGQIVKLLFYDISNGEWEAYGGEVWYLVEDEFADLGIEILIKMVETNRHSIKLLTNIVSANEIGLNNVEKDLYDKKLNKR